MLPEVLIPGLAEGDLVCALNESREEVRPVYIHHLEIQFWGLLFMNNRIQHVLGMSILINQVHFNGQFTICTLLKVLRRVAVLYPEPNTVLVKVVGYLRVQIICRSGISTSRFLIFSFFLHLKPKSDL